MSEGKSADDSNLLIKTAIAKLNPKNGGDHKYRMRRLNKFRNYVTDGESTPEFYDDDLITLFAGSNANGDDLGYSLLMAAGEPSSDHSGVLKKSAKFAMGLVKFLVCDFVDIENGKKVELEDDELNGFAHAFCCLTIEQLQQCKFEIHLLDTEENSKRTGSKEDACELILMLILRHMDESGSEDDPITLQSILPNPKTRQAFQRWVESNKSAGVVDQIRERLALADELAPEDDDSDDDGPGGKNKAKGIHSKGAYSSMDDVGFSLGPPKRWVDSKLAVPNSDAKARAIELEADMAAVEKERTMFERQKTNGLDPLGLREADFDLRFLQMERETLVHEELEFFQEEEEEEMQKIKAKGGAASANELLSIHAKRDAFMAMIEKSIAITSQKPDANEEVELTGRTENSIGSVLPIDPDFDPLLFLSLVHRDATYHQLQDALTRLKNTATNQHSRLQNIVSDNYGLFVRCGEGIDVFDASDEEDDAGNEKSFVRAFSQEQLDIVENLADACSFQAKKSFKPLLDNTNEVRKTQRALALLHRVAPLLQIPHQMRQHIEAGKLNSAIKAYRRILVIDKDCKIDLLRFVKAKADEASREARIIVEKTLADASVPVSSLIEAIRDLGELNELNVRPIEEKKKKKHNDDKTPQGMLRKHPPALACLMLQASHFSAIVEHVIDHSENITTRIYKGDLTALQEDFTSPMEAKSETDSVVSDFSSNTSDSRRKNKWRYDILEARVKATVQAVAIARKWLKRLILIGVAAMDVERRHAVRNGQRNKLSNTNNKMMKKPLEIFVTQVTPVMLSLVLHTTFCSLGCSNTHNSLDGEVQMTFGRDSPEALQILLRTPLPPHESSRCATEMADLVEIVRECAHTANSLRPTDAARDVDGKILETQSSSAAKRNILKGSPLVDCLAIAEDALITIERRRCIYAFHVCTKSCGRRASGSGIFDGDALIDCLKGLSAVLRRPEECKTAIGKGCQLVIMRCCQGLSEYVRDKGGAARLKAVSECATMLATGIQSMVREVSLLSRAQCEDILDVTENEILKLERTLFEEFLEEIIKDVKSCVNLGFLDREKDNGNEEEEEEVAFDQKQIYTGSKNRAFPGYLSASLLSIVRCRAKVEKALGPSTIRKSDNEPYLHIAMTTASDVLIEDLCNQINERRVRMSGKQSDRMANELQFLVNTLHNDMSEDVIQSADQCRRMLCAKAGRGRGIQGDGPDGLAAIEELERLGRVYVMCLGHDE